jgi:hypothetical protein
MLFFKLSIALLAPLLVAAVTVSRADINVRQNSGSDPNGSNGVGPAPDPNGSNGVGPAPDPNGSNGVGPAPDPNGSNGVGPGRK